MGLWDKITGEFIDIIEWLDDSNDTLAYRFQRYDNEIKMGAQLTVREGRLLLSLMKVSWLIFSSPVVTA